MLRCSQPGPVRRSRRARCVLGKGAALWPSLTAVLAVVLGLGPTIVDAGARFQAVDGPSPARGHAEVVAHGVAALPRGQVVWGVAQDTVDPGDEVAAQTP